jgi:hypothetical protein
MKADVTSTKLHVMIVEYGLYIVQKNHRCISKVSINMTNIICVTIAFEPVVVETSDWCTQFLISLTIVIFDIGSMTFPSEKVIFVKIVNLV